MSCSRQLFCRSLQWLALCQGRIWLSILSIGCGAIIHPLAANYTLHTWNTADGLPQNSGTALAQTSDGYLWIGTFNGLVRFNGVDFTRFTVANTKEFPNDDINSLREDRDGRLWIGTYRGLVCNEAGRFIRWREPEKLSQAVIRMFAEHPDGTLFVASDRGFWRIENGRVAELEAEGAIWPSWSWIACDPQGEVWASQQKSLYRLIGGKLERQFQFDSPVSALVVGRDGTAWCGHGEKVSWFKPAEGPTDAPFSIGEVRALLEARDGDWWIGTVRQGLHRWAKGILTPVIPVEGTLNNRIMSLMEDREANIWVGTDGGGFSRVTPALVTTYDGRHGLPDSDVVSILEDREGRIWLGTFNGALCVGENGKWQRYTSELLRKDEGVLSLCQTRDGTIWIGRNGGPLARIRSGVLDLEPRSQVGTVRALLEDREGGLWIGSQDHGVEFLSGDQIRHWNLTNGLSDNFVTAIAQDGSGAIWIGTPNGLNRIAGGEVKRFSVSDGLGANQVHGLFVDREATLWIGTAGGGLTRFRGGVFATVTSSQGLASDVVAQILEDGDDFWIGSTTGVSRVNKRSLHDVLDGRARFVHRATYDKKDGMQGTDCPGGFQPTCAKTRDGRLWFCTSAGVTVFNARELKPAGQSPVHIERVLVDGFELMNRDRPALSLASGMPPDWTSTSSNPKARAAPTSPALLIPPGAKRLEFHCAALSMAAPERAEFRFWLKGYEEGWQEPGARRIAYYNRVPPGQYSFHVAVVNSDGSQGESRAVLALTVRPTWLQTWWYRSAIILCIAGLIGVLYHNRVSGLKRIAAQRTAFSRRLIDSQEAERKRIATELHDSLGQSLLIIKNQARRGLRSLATIDSLRTSLNEIAETAGEAVDEVRTIARALRPYQLDSLGLSRAIESLVNHAAEVSNLKHRMTMDNIDGTLSPADEINVFRIVQESLNNIVKHADATELCLTAHVADAVVVITIEDNGRGFDAESVSSRDGPGGFGLRGIEERVRLSGGRWKVESEPGKGTRVQCEIPCAGGASG